MVSFVDVHRDTWPVAVMCRTIGLVERTYHAAKVRPRSKRSLSDEVHKVEIRRVWEQNYRCYGARRIFKQLHREGYPIARCTVTRLMGDIGICGVQRGKKRFTTRRRHGRRTWSSGASSPSDPTSCGWPTSPTRRPGTAGCTWRSSST